MEVNCEKMIVFSSPSERSVISFMILVISRILAEEGGRAPATRDLRRALLANSSQSLQYFNSESDEFAEERLKENSVDI